MIYDLEKGVYHLTLYINLPHLPLLIYSMIVFSFEFYIFHRLKTSPKLV